MQENDNLSARIGPG
jgi:hypothetical protein